MGSLPTGRCIWRSASTATAPNKSSGSGSDPPTGESSKFWLTVLSELKSRGVADVCIVCCDGLSGLPDAINVIWPAATVQLCVVHLIRASLRYASKRDWTPPDPTGRR